MRATLLLFCLISFLRAEAPPLVKTEVVALALIEPLEQYSVQNGEGRSRVDAGLTGLGQPVSYHGPARLSLMAPVSETLSPDAAPLPPAAQVDLPPNATRVLLVCLKREGHPLRLMAFDISPERVPAGDYLFLHFAKTEVAVMLGEETFTLAPGQIRVVGRQDWRRDNADLIIRLVAKVGNENRLVFSSVWGHHAERRNYVFVFEGEHASMPLVLRKVQDRAPPTTAAN